VTVGQALLRGVNRALGPLGFRLGRSGYVAFEDYRGFIPFARTLAEAQAAGLSVTDYVDSHYNVAGATQATVDRMAEMGALHAGVERVCELGPGSGRYLEKVQKACRPTAYEVYETALDWRDYVVRTFGVVGHDADGVSLKQTADGSCDLVHAHKVFPGVPFLSTCRYLVEMARVVRPGGHVIAEFYNARSLRHLVKRIKPPTAVSHTTHDEHVFTRYDDASAIRRYLPPELDWVATRGIRVITPLAGVLRVPLLGAAVRWAEQQDKPRSRVRPSRDLPRGQPGQPAC